MSLISVIVWPKVRPKNIPTFAVRHVCGGSSKTGGAELIGRPLRDDFAVVLLRYGCNPRSQTGSLDVKASRAKALTRPAGEPCWWEPK
jgi:hypothetical protein